MEFRIDLLKKVILHIILSALVCQAFAQIDSVKLDGAYLKHYWTDARDIVTSPLKWDKKSWGKFGLVAGTTTALFFLDEPIKDFIQDNKDTKIGSFSHSFLDPMGSQYSVGFAATWYLWGLALKNSKAQSAGLMAIQSYAISGLLVRIPKELFGRTRPGSYGVEGAFDFRGPGNGVGFPSGHTISAFSVATIFAEQYKDTKWVPIASYSLATLAGLSRIYDNKHWASDVFVGAIMGIAIGKFIYRSHKQDNLAILPFYQQGNAGLSLTLFL